MFQKLFISLIVLVALSACGQTKTQGYYLSHLDELDKDLAECKKSGISSYNCNEADKAEFLRTKKK